MQIGVVFAVLLLAATAVLADPPHQPAIRHSSQLIVNIPHSTLEDLFTPSQTALDPHAMVAKIVTQPVNKCTSADGTSSCSCLRGCMATATGCSCNP